jgi:hypothetical protein
LASVRLLFAADWARFTLRRAACACFFVAVAEGSFSFASRRATRSG